MPTKTANSTEIAKRQQNLGHNQKNTLMLKTPSISHEKLDGQTLQQCKGLSAPYFMRH